VSNALLNKQMEIISKNNSSVVLVDPLKSFLWPEVDQSKLFVDYVHLTPDGNKLLAKEIFNDYRYRTEDEIIDGIRYLNPDYMAANDMVLYGPTTWVADSEADKVLVDTMEYVGLPIASLPGDGSAWNLNPNVIQGGPNVHNSALADMYQDAEGEFLKARLISYAEVCFILAEAADKGWNVGSQQSWYENHICLASRRVSGRRC